MDAITRECLKRLTYGDAKPVRIWRTCASYENLVTAGYAEEVPQDNVLVRQFRITKAGEIAVKMT